MSLSTARSQTDTQRSEVATLRVEADDYDTALTGSGLDVSSGQEIVRRLRAGLNSALLDLSLLDTELGSLQGQTGDVAMVRLSKSPSFYSHAVSAPSSVQSVTGRLLSPIATFFQPTVSPASTGVLYYGPTGESVLDGAEFSINDSVAVTLTPDTGKTITNVVWKIGGVVFRDNDADAPYTLAVNSGSVPFGSDFTGQGTTGSANSFNLGLGDHTFTAEVTHSDASTFTVSATVTVVGGGGSTPGTGFTYASTIGGVTTNIAVPAGFPSPDTTGYSGTLTSTQSSFVIISSAGTYENVDYQAGVRVTATGVTLRNCRIRRPGGGTSVLEVRHGGTTPTDLVLEDCTVIGDSQAFCVGWTDNGRGFTLTRCDIYGGTDLIKASIGCIIEDCFLHEPDKQPGDHNDLIQNSGGGSNVQIRRNTMLGPYQTSTSCVIAQTTVGVIDNMNVTDNFMFGGSYSLYLRDKGVGYGPPTNSSATGNYFCANSTGAGNYTVSETVTLSGNVIYADWPA